MAKLTWDADGNRFYETGIKDVALYVYDSTVTGTGLKYANGVAWNGVTALTESPSGAEETKLYADDREYLSLRSIEDFGLTLECYSYPDAFAECNGERMLKAGVAGVTFGQQTRKKFCLVYKTTKGNDTDGNDKGYIIHIVYGCTASPAEKSYATINDSPEAITFSFEMSASDIEFTYGSDTVTTSHIEIDSTVVNSTKLQNIEAALYGDTNSDPTIKSPTELIAML